MKEFKRLSLIVALIVFSGSLVLLGSLILRRDNVPRGHNLILNPSFEEGETGWEWLQWSEAWAPFDISTNRSYEGSSAALLKVSSARENRSTVVWGVVQEIDISDRFPNRLEGYYFVEKWNRGADKQYIQVVIIDLAGEVSGTGAQIRYILSGVNKAPYNLKNAHYVFVDPERKTEPVQGMWVKFSVNPSKDFEESWGYVPSSGHKVRLLFEARFDDRERGDPDAEAYVYYDGLYFGQSEE